MVAGLVLGLWLRWQFIHTVKLYPDEFVTLLAVKMINQSGWPVMPSGLFYEHGLLFSYLGSVASRLGALQLTVRYVSLVCGSLTLILTFWLGRRWFSPLVGLIAMFGLAVAPTAIHWSGRARMYALLQLLVLLTVFLLYEGVGPPGPQKAYLRWLALLAYLGATLTHFVAVTLAPPLVLAVVGVVWLQARSTDQSKTRWFYWLRKFWLELLALGGVIVIAFLVKRSGQPKGIAALAGEAGQAAKGIIEVFQIYSDFSFDLLAGWQAISPFYLTLPALIFTPFVLITIGVAVKKLWRHITLKSSKESIVSAYPSLFLSIILITTTLEMTLLISPDRRDDKYQFMLLPLLFLLGAAGVLWLIGWGKRLIVNSEQLIVNNGQNLINDEGQRTKDETPIPNPESRIPASQPTLNPELRTLNSIFTVLLCAIIIYFSWPGVQTLLTNTGDDYASAFAYVQEQWQEGDTVLTGTPAAAALYLDRNDFYSVQRQGGYDYRILTVADQAVDRWLASPAIRTEAALHNVLANNNVWLILERWGLQKEYYDLPFQQQLLAQTDYVTEAQGIFVLHSKANPHPISLTPTQPVTANFAGLVQLQGYTIESGNGVPGQPVSLTLYWEALAAIDRDYTVFVHLRDANGGNVAQADHRPLGRVYPTSIWPIAETIRENSALFLPAELTSGDYELWAGLYLLETGERLPVQNDTSGENAVRLGGLSIGP